MGFVSYAQNLEDVVLWKALKNVNNGFYIDVGANDPSIDSVTKSFYNLGWRGINVEPVRRHYNALLADRPEDINLNCALSESEGELAIWECDVRGWATLDKVVANAHEKDGYHGQWFDVVVKTLADICNEYQPQNIHFLKVDVEGLEISVLKGNDWDKFRPWVVIVESTFPNTQMETHFELEEFLLRQNYLFAYADGLNRFYTSFEHQELLEALKYPPNVFDNYQTYSEAKAISEREQIKKDFDEYKADTEKQLVEQNALDNLITLKDQNELSLIIGILQNKFKKLDLLALNVESVLSVINMQQKYEEMTRELTTLSADNKCVHLAYDTLRQTNIDAQQRMEVLELELLQLKKGMQEIYKSTSWRISAPVRFIGRFRAKSVVVSHVNSSRFSYFKRLVRKLIRIINNHPKLRMFLVRISKKLGLYVLLRDYYLKLLIGSSPKTDFSLNEILLEQNKFIASFKTSTSLTVDELHQRIKNELVTVKEEGNKP